MDRSKAPTTADLGKVTSLNSASLVFLELMLAKTQAPIWVSSLPNVKSDGPPERHILSRELDQIQSFVENWDRPGRGVYFCLSSIETGRRRKKNNARETFSLFVDIDFKNVDLNQKEILKRLKSLPYPPNRVHASGNGLHCFWIFDKPIDTQRQIESTERLLKRLSDLVGGDQMVCHVAALLRLPGTHNTKNGDWKEVRVLHDAKQTYSIQKLEEWLASTSTPIIKRKTSDNVFLQLGTNGPAFRPPMDVYKALAQMRPGVNVHNTQLSAAASLMTKGFSVEDSVAMILEATKRIGEPDWDWVQEERTIRKMCTDWREKHPEIVPLTEVHLSDESRFRSGRLILDPADPMASARSMFATLYMHESGAHTLVRHRAAFLRWTGSRFQILTNEAQNAEIWRYLERARKIDKQGAETAYKPKSNNVSNVFGALAAITELDSYMEAPAWLDEDEDRPPPTELFATENGLLHLPTLTLYPPSPAFFGLTASKVTFDPAAPAPTGWFAFLDQVIGDPEAILTLQEWIGYCLVSDTSQQKILFCKGPRRSGKGTMARVLTELLGRGSVAGPTMSSLGTQFGLQNLITKSLAIISDARIGRRTDNSAVVERLLTISGEDTITIDRKFLDAWTGRLGTRIMIMTNELPALTEGSGALVGRFIVLVFQQSFFGREDIGLTNRLLTELPGILNWSIEGYRSLQQRGHFLQPQNALEEIEAMETLGSPVKAFIRDKCVTGPEHRIAIDELYEAYKDWCQDQDNRHPSNKEWFGRNLNSAVPGVKTVRPEVEGERVRTYVGIALRPQPAQSFQVLSPGRG